MPRKSMFTVLARLSSSCFAPAVHAQGRSFDGKRSCADLVALLSLTGVAAEENARCVERQFYAERSTDTGSTAGDSSHKLVGVDYLAKSRQKYMLAAELKEIQSSIVRQGYISAYLPLLEACAFSALGESPRETAPAIAMLPAEVQCEALVALGKLAMLCAPMATQLQRRLCALIEANAQQPIDIDGAAPSNTRDSTGNTDGNGRSELHADVDVRVSATAVFVWGALLGSLSRETTARIERALCRTMVSVVSCARRTFVHAAAQGSSGNAAREANGASAAGKTTTSSVTSMRKAPDRKKRRKSQSRGGKLTLGHDPLDNCAALRHACVKVLAEQTERKQRLCDATVMDAVLPALLDPNTGCRECAESFLRTQQIREGVSVGRYIFLAMARCTVGLNTDGNHEESVGEMPGGCLGKGCKADERAADRYARCAMIKRLLLLFKHAQPQRSPELLDLLIRELGRRPRFEHAYFVSQINPPASLATCQPGATSDSVNGVFMACLRQLESVFAAQPLLLPACQTCPEMAAFLETFLHKIAGKGKQSRQQRPREAGGQIETAPLIAKRLLRLLEETKVKTAESSLQVGTQSSNGDCSHNRAGVLNGSAEHHRSNNGAHVNKGNHGLNTCSSSSSPTPPANPSSTTTASRRLLLQQEERDSARAIQNAVKIFTSSCSSRKQHSGDGDACDDGRLQSMQEYRDILS